MAGMVKNEDPPCPTKTPCFDVYEDSKYQFMWLVHDIALLTFVVENGM